MFKLIFSMATSNLKKNHSLYLPYALTTIMVTMILYITHALSAMPELSTLRGGGAIAQTLGFGVIVVQLVALLTILYANAFVTKNRLKEYGLYSILGLDRKNIQLLSFIELLLFSVVSVGLGVVLGIVFHRFSFAVLLKLIRIPIGIEYSMQLGSVGFVLISMAFIFGVVFFLNATKMYMSRPLEMLSEKKKGETKGRFILLRALIGAGLLGGAYYMSQTIEAPVAALYSFFVAVLLVVLATYILFDAGSIALLSLLQKNKRLFYQPTNFISISNLKFRMRKNAAGLASICILSTMVLVTLATTVALQTGTADLLKKSYPTDYSATAFVEDTSTINQLSEQISKIKAQSKGTIANEMNYLSVLRAAKSMDGGVDIEGVYPGDSPAAFITFLSAEDYNRIFGTNYKPGDNEAVLGLVKGDDKNVSAIRVNGQLTLQVKEMMDSTGFKEKLPQLPYVADNVYVAVVKDPSKMIDAKLGRGFYYALWNTSTDIQAKTEEFEAYANVLEASNEDFITVGSREDAAKDIYGFMGSLLFVGALLSIAFFIGAVLVIYYKQISEGYEDRDRFVILQKLGIDQKTIKKSINRQVLIVFFLPLVTAFIHTAFAFKMYRKIIQLFGVDGNVTLNATIVIGAIFVVVYLIVYQITSRSYYKIIKR
ncbi:FtsX-like permease family protein [Granulicatella sp. UMB5615A]|uniref:ABC transporter permease n=1 Tax=Granulicatella sp. UMB5615A TaxID=3050606 RepID=UPI00255307ED|nr:FtsX-like permease family protein [Granulicatella sp. UMB5615A]MDK8522446.1 ABC transporter permease [Granulicatella sp. UMB5615A]